MTALHLIGLSAPLWLVPGGLLLFAGLGRLLGAA